MALTAITIEGTPASTYARNVKLDGYGKGSKRGRNLVIPHRDGEYTQAAKWFTGTDLLLEVMLKTTPSPEENLSGLLALINRQVGTATIAGTHPLAGSVQTEIEMLRSPRQDGNNPNLYRFLLRNPKGTWESVTATTTTGSTGTPAAFTTSGDRPVDSFSLRFDTTGLLEHTNSLGDTSRLTLTAGASTGTTVDMGDRTVLTTTGGAADNFLTVDQPWWMRLEGGKIQGFTASTPHTFTWRSQWAI